METKKFLVYGIALLLSAGGCNESEMTEVGNASSLKVYHITNSGCLSNLRSGAADALETIKRHETLHLKALGNGWLQIRHDSVIYQCAARIELHASRSGNLIHIEERDVATAQANCLCPQNLQYELPLAYGDYQIRINDGRTFPFTHTAGLDMTIVIGEYKGQY